MANPLHLEEKRGLTRAFLSLSFSSPAKQHISTLHLQIKVRARHTQADLQSRYALNHTSAKSHGPYSRLYPAAKTSKHTESILRTSPCRRYSGRGICSCAAPLPGRDRRIGSWICCENCRLSVQSYTLTQPAHAAIYPSNVFFVSSFQGFFSVGCCSEDILLLIFWYDECRWLRRMLKKAGRISAAAQLCSINFKRATALRHSV